MKSSSKRTVSSSADNQNEANQTNRQEEAFIVSEERSIPDHRRTSDVRISRLSAQQFRLANRMGDMQSDITKNIEEVRTDLQAKAAKELEAATKDIDGKVKNLENDLNKKVLEARNKIIEPLAIFVGLFTFISIGFQVFTQVKEYILWMPILGAVLGGIIIFAGLVIHASSVSADAKERRKYTGVIIVLGAVIFIAAGVYYHKAVEVLSVEDSKSCVLVKPAEEGAEESMYCKLSR